MKNIRKSLSLILSVLMLCSVFAFSVSAEECAHSYTATTVAPNCVENGYVLHVCSLCGDSYKENLAGSPALGHAYGEWEVIVEASCDREGISTRNCTRCGAADTKTVAASTHVDSDYSGECDRCGEEMEVEQVFSPFDWLVAFFNFIRQWFMDIFA